MAETELQRPSRLFIGAIAILMTFGPTAIDMYLPALTAIGRDFGEPQSRIQWSLSAFFLGFGLGQLLWGALGDQFGRRRPVMAAILLYGIASIGCSLSGDIVQLAGWRFVQAVGACAGPVLARAMIRDRFGQDRAASLLSLMMLIMGIAPMAAPLVGGQILVLANWRTLFWVQAAFGIIAFAGIWSLPETLPRDKRRQTRFASLIEAYALLLGSRRYLGYCLSSAFIYGGMFAYISGTPFVYIEYFGVPPQHYGFLFGLNIFGMIVVNTVNSRIVLRMGTDRVLRLGCALAAVMGLALLFCALTGIGGLVGIAGTLFLFMGMTGMIAANAMAGAMSSFPFIAGSASALTGMVQFAMGAAAGWAVGILADGTPVPLALVICACALASIGFNLWLVRPAPAGR